MTSTAFGGTYTRKPLPESKPCRVRRLRCKTCLRTHSILPACLFSRVRYPSQTLAPYLEHSQTMRPVQVWQQNLSDGPDDLTTLYHWLRRLKVRLRHLIGLLQQTLLELAPDTKLQPYQTTVLQSAIDTHHTQAPSTGTSTSSAEVSGQALCHLSYWLAARLLQVTDQLIEQPSDLSVLAFLNHFSWRQTGQCLLSPVANAPP